MKKRFLFLSLLAIWSLMTLPDFAYGSISSNSFIGTGLSTNFSYPPKDTFPKINLFKKISHFLKFRKNIRAAERERILKVLSESPLQDSIMINAREIDLLNKALSKTINQRFDSLVALIYTIKHSQEQTDSAFSEDTASTQRAVAINEAKVNELVSKILPLLERKANKNKNISNQLTILRNIRYFYGRYRRPVDTSEIINNKVKLILKRKDKVYAFYRSEMGGNYLGYNFGIINTLIYDGFIINGQTGDCNLIDHTENGATNVLKTAREARCNLLLCIHGGSKSNMSTFLSNQDNQQEKLIDRVLKLVQQYSLEGVNLNFVGLENKYRQNFVDFIQLFHHKAPRLQMILTLPPGKGSSAFDINKLNKYSVLFLIDFSLAAHNENPNPPASLKGNDGDGIVPTISGYLNSNVPPSKFIIGFPYYGSRWGVNPESGNKWFEDYISYNEITSNSPGFTLFDPESASTFINLKDDNQLTTGQIWYNDGGALDNIYDFILKNGLGGIAVLPLKSEIGYNDLWKGIGNAFLQIDTLSVFTTLYRPVEAIRNDIIRKYMDDTIKKESFWTSWDSLKNHVWVKDGLDDSTLLSSILFIFREPCKSCFIPDGLQSLWGTTVNNHIETIKASTALLYRLNRVVYTMLAGVSLLFLLAFLIFGYIYITKIRKKGKSWNYRKLTGSILVALAGLVILFAFMFMFLSGGIGIFGKSGKNDVCYDMPFGILLLIIASGFLFAVLIMRYLVFPLIKRDDVP